MTTPVQHDETAAGVEVVAGDGPQRKRWRRSAMLVAALLVLTAGGIAGAVLLAGNDEESEVAASGLQTARVLISDLFEIKTFPGTLGFDAGDPVTARRVGTITQTIESGTIADEGDVLFSIDEEPVVLLSGAHAAWRPIGLIPEPEPVVVQAQGTVTWVAPEGSHLDQGDIVVKVDDMPVVKLNGDIPPYRLLRRGSEGADVAQLERALVDLGYDPDTTVTVDEEFTWSTERMVRRWEDDLGLDEDGIVRPGDIVFLPASATVETELVTVGQYLVGAVPVLAVSTAPGTIDGGDVYALEAALHRAGFDADGTLVVDRTFTPESELAVIQWQRDIGAKDDGIVDLGEVVFLPGPVRIDDHLANPGDLVQVGVPVLATSTITRVVTVDLPAADQDLLEESDRVVVTLPDDTEVGGVVTSVATTASLAPTGEAFFEVVIELDDQQPVEDLDKAPVDVDVITDTRQGVMAVPVAALLALGEGGYALEIELTDGSTSLVAVEPGMYADGLVEVTSDELRPDDRVVVP